MALCQSSDGKAENNADNEGDAAKRPMVPDHDSPAKEKPPEIVDSWSAKEYFSYAGLMSNGNFL